MKILETTLRDGSYAIDFKFTPKDTAIISSEIEKAGFDLIEIGHGLGFYAKEAGKGDAAATDREYLEAASKTLKTAKFGMFCIPGIARLEDIDMAAEYGMKFIRIGTNISELESGKAFFKKAKDYGMYTASNLMKSYAVPPEEFAKYAKIAEDFGADIVYLVDSAGGMMPEDIEKYFNATRRVSNVDLGFHGHNNLGLANANTLKAIELGAAIVDSSLKGMGRSAGNAITEMLVMLMKKRGIEVPIDEFMVMDLAEKYIAPLLHNMKDTSISITGGYAEFHSSFLKNIYKYSEKYSIDPRKVIIELTKRDKINAPDELLEEISSQLSQESKRIVPSKDINPFITKGNKIEKPDIENKVQKLIDQLNIHSNKKGLYSIVNLVLSDDDKQQNFVSDFIQENQMFAIGSIEYYDNDFIQPLLRQIDGKLDYILLDTSCHSKIGIDKINQVREGLKLSKLLLYDDRQLWAKSIITILLTKYSKENCPSILIFGAGELVNELLHQAKSRGCEVFLANDEVSDEIKNQPFIIISADGHHKLTAEMISDYNQIVCIVDAKIGSIDSKVINKNEDIIMIRPDMRPVIAGEVFHQILNYNLVNKDLGKTTMNNIEVVAGGMIGKKDQIVVDSIGSPTKVVGIAKGDGFVNYEFSEEELEMVKDFEKYLIIKNSKS